jgi:hypothetical protein
MSLAVVHCPAFKAFFSYVTHSVFAMPSFDNISSLAYLQRDRPPDNQPSLRSARDEPDHIGFRGHVLLMRHVDRSPIRSLSNFQVPVRTSAQNPCLP